MTISELSNERYSNRWPWIGGLAVLALIAYANGINGAFLFDDEAMIVENTSLRDWQWRLFLLGPRSFADLTFTLNYKIGGLDVRGYHVANILIHLVAACIMFGLVCRTLSLPKLAHEYQTHARLLGFLCAAIWLTHPLQTESVTYIVQRLESLMGLFFLLTMYCALRGATQERRSVAWYFASIAAFMFCVASKETAAVAPLVVLLYDRMFLATSWREVARRRWGLYLGFMPGLIYLFCNLSGALLPSEVSPEVVGDIGERSAGFGISFLTPWMYLRSQPAVLVHYIRLAFWPDQLCLDYLWKVENNPWRIYGLGAIVVAAVVASIWAFMRQKPAGFLGLMFFLTLAPTSSFVPILDLAFEHRMYLPLAPLVVLVIVAGYSVANRVARNESGTIAFTAILGVLIVALTTRTVLRNADYRDPVLMWQNVVKLSPHNASAHYSLALSLTRSNRADRLELARNHFETAVQLAPVFTNAHLNLAVVLEMLGLPVEADSEFKIAEELDRKNSQVQYEYGRFLVKLGRPNEARERFENAISLKPNYAQAYDALGNLLSREGKYQMAIPYYRKALQSAPEMVGAQVHLAMALSRIGQLTESNQLCQAILASNAQDPVSQTILAWNLSVANEEQLRDGTKALELAQAAVSASRRESIEALEALAAAFAELGLFQDAVATIEEAIELKKGEPTESDSRRLIRLKELFDSKQKARQSWIERQAM